MGGGMSFHVPEKHRIKSGPYGSDASFGNNGAFFIPAMLVGARGAPVTVIASDEFGWDHVSASFPNRCPSWEEMCALVAIFWDAEDAVMQLHPPRSEWINNHPYCLHLWRPTGGEAIPLPPSLLVGFKELNR